MKGGHSCDADADDDSSCGTPAAESRLPRRLQTGALQLRCVKPKSLSSGLWLVFRASMAAFNDRKCGMGIFFRPGIQHLLGTGTDRRAMWNLQRPNWKLRPGMGLANDSLRALTHRSLVNEKTATGKDGQRPGWSSGWRTAAGAGK